MSHIALNPRAETLLKALIERYIAEGEPVGSRTLARDMGNELSPATIRNVMADLEELGLIHSPHTSAGRVPTQLGYRVFVDTLLKVRPLESLDVRRIEGELDSAGDPSRLIESASSLLSQVTHLAGLVMVPKAEQFLLRQIEFLNLSANRVLVILVTQEGRVHNRLITTARPFSPAELTEAANYFNRSYAGRSLDEVRQALAREMRDEGGTMLRSLSAAMDMAQHLCEPAATPETLVVRGESNLMDIPELGDVRKLRLLFDAFTTKRDLLQLLDQSMRVSGVQIFIGGESGYEAFEDLSLVTAPYQIDGRIVGTLGVIGPTRMAYEQVIPIVDITARLLSGALSQDTRST
jgi:heat-inducible transcriptional repressor